MKDFKLENIIIEGEEFKIAVPADGEVVEGTIYEVTAAELKKIDDYEGKDYTRREVALSSGNLVWVYVKMPKHANS